MSDGTGNDPHFDPFADPFAAPAGEPSTPAEDPPKTSSPPSSAPRPSSDAGFDPEKTTQITSSPPPRPPVPDASWDPERTTVVPADRPSSTPPPVFSAQQRPGPPGSFVPPGYAPPPVYTASYAPPSQPPPPRTNRGLIIALAAAAAVIAVIVVVVVAASGSSSSSSADTPRAAVQGYLDALARGDAAAALGYGKDQPGSKDLLTDDVLKRQLAKMPITDIQILDDGSPMGDFATVHVSARFGDQVSDARLMMHQVDGWKLDTAAIKIDNSALGTTNKALKTLTVFGKAADNPVYVFPGWVDFASSNANLAITATPPLLGDLGSITSGLVTSAMKADLSDAGTKAIKSTLSGDLAKCTASNRLEPPGCPLKAQPYGLVDGTARWGPIDDLSGVDLTFNPYDMTALVLGQVKTTFSAQSTYGRPSDGTITGFISGSADVSTDPPTLTYR